MRSYVITSKWFNKLRLETEVNIVWRNAILAVLMEHYLRVELPSILQNDSLPHSLRNTYQKYGGELHTNFQDYITDTVLKVKHKIP